MVRGIFIALMIASLAFGLFLFLSQANYSARFLMLASSMAFLVFSLGMHGLIAFSLKSTIKRQVTFYPVWMWALWALLFMLFVVFLLPAICL